MYTLAAASATLAAAAAVIKAEQLASNFLQSALSFTSVVVVVLVALIATAVAG